MAQRDGRASDPCNANSAVAICASVIIGTLNEGPLHQALKTMYSSEGARLEVPVDGYVADVQGTDDVIYEIQTGSFSAIRDKLRRLVEGYQVVLVHPIARMRYIVKLPEEGSDEWVSRRRSPKRGAVSHVVDQLVSIPDLLNHPNFELEVVLIDEDELRVHDPKRIRHRNGWRVVQRRLIDVVEQVRIASASDLMDLVRSPLPATFTTADLAAAIDEPRWLAQKLAYCLRQAGEIVIDGKQGNALVYRRAC
ncbi:MAG: hypothetical protein QF921_05010 [Pseudomonadales bacterium]|jgi:hypothetical protein|nr:hypothetical protein [Pseudomonadales bacterium]MDP6471870.1 hypothetical protein [Pseudomonadales bacterium]MDP6826860.1 hypothetical protein [Pseudomonadales bacterium]MDP6970862.1 hypothetical protein [Pseudomonadales bacterium]